MGDDQANESWGLPDAFDHVYFNQSTWSERVEDWVEAANKLEFSSGNRHVVAKAICDEESGLRVVVNIGSHAILKLLPSGRYLNLYESPEIGGERQTPSQSRIKVDNALGLSDTNVYFGAVALGGVGVRFYGEYCMVLKLENIDEDPQLFDRDSYDILLEPIGDLPDPQVLIDRLLGSWQRDVQSMVLMKVLPELVHQTRLVTTGTVSEAVLKDQEFIEVHLRPNQDGLLPGETRSFGQKDLEEIRESPEEVAVATRLREREADGLRISEVEHEWLLRRENVSRVVGKTELPTRVVTQHGRGYQWK